MDEIRADHFVLGVAQNALEIGLAGLLHRGGNFGIARFLHRSHREVHDRDGRVGTRMDMPVSLPFTSGSTSRRPWPRRWLKESINGRAAATFPILLAWAVHGLLRGGVTVYRGHQTFFNAKAFLEQHMDTGARQFVVQEALETT